MNVLYDNYLIDSELSATNENENRPVTNLIHNYLELPFFSTSFESVITAILENTEDIDCIAFDYHNIETMTVSFYDVFNNLLGIETITVIDDCNFIIFNTVYQDVKKIIFNIAAPDYYLYIGGLFAGEYLELPDFIQSPTKELEINDSNFRSSGGQSSGNRKRNFEPITLSFQNISNDDLDDFRIYLRYVQGSIPHFVDIYPDAHTEFSPFYSVVDIKKIPVDKRRISDFNFSFKLTYREAR